MRLPTRARARPSLFVVPDRSTGGRRPRHFINVTNLAQKSGLPVRHNFREPRRPARPSPVLRKPSLQAQRDQTTPVRKATAERQPPKDSQRSSVACRQTNILSSTLRQRARCSALVLSLPSPTITNRVSIPFFKTRASISTQSTGRFTGRKFETWTSKGFAVGRKLSLATRQPDDAHIQTDRQSLESPRCRQTEKSLSSLLSGTCEIAVTPSDCTMP